MTVYLFFIFDDLLLVDVGATGSVSDPEPLPLLFTTDNTGGNIHTEVPGHEGLSSS